MWKSFNSKIFAVAMIPFSFYVIISCFVFVNAGYRFDVFDPISILLISGSLVLSALCFSLKKRQFHYLGLFLMIALGGLGVYLGFTGGIINWIELICSACMIAFAFAMFEFVGNHRGQ